MVEQVPLSIEELRATAGRKDDTDTRHQRDGRQVGRRPPGSEGE